MAGAGVAADGSVVGAELEFGAEISGDVIGAVGVAGKGAICLRFKTFAAGTGGSPSGVAGAGLGGVEASGVVMAGVSSGAGVGVVGAGWLMLAASSRRLELSSCAAAGVGGSFGIVAMGGAGVGG